MLFHVTCTFKNSDEESAARGLQLFANGTPPDGFEFKAHYSFADGSGGVNPVEADSALPPSKACAVFAPCLDFVITPIVEIDAAAAQEALAYRGSLS